MQAISWLPGLLARLFVFQVLFLSFVDPDRVLFMHETGYLCGSDSFERQVGADSR